MALTNGERQRLWRDRHPKEAAARLEALTAEKAHKRRVAEARRRAEVIGDALDWDIKRIEEFLVLSVAADDLVKRELVTMQRERSTDDSGGEK